MWRRQKGYYLTAGGIRICSWDDGKGFYECRRGCQVSTPFPSRCISRGTGASPACMRCTGGAFHDGCWLQFNTKILNCIKEYCTAHNTRRQNYTQILSGLRSGDPQTLTF